MNELNCKWVSRNMTTRNNTLWEINVPKELPDRNNLVLCEEGLFHYVKHPLLAVMFKYFHGCESYTKLYEVIPEGQTIHGYNLAGSTKLTLVRELEIPKITLEQHIAFGILCAKEVCKKPNFVNWANKWLNDEDQSQQNTINILSDIPFSEETVRISLQNCLWYLSLLENPHEAEKYQPYIYKHVDYIAFLVYTKNVDLVSIAKKAMEIQ